MPSPKMARCRKSAKYERCVKHVKKTGHPNPWAVCTVSVCGGRHSGLGDGDDWQESRSFDYDASKPRGQGAVRRIERRKIDGYCAIIVSQTRGRLAEWQVDCGPRKSRRGTASDLDEGQARALAVSAELRSAAPDTTRRLGSIAFAGVGFGR